MKLKHIKFYFNLFGNVYIYIICMYIKQEKYKIRTNF